MLVAAAPVRTAEASEPDETRRALPLDAPHLEPLRQAWSEIREELGREAWQRAADRVPGAVDARRDLGLRNVTTLSRALLHAAEEAAEAGSLEGAVALSGGAVELSPERVHPRLQHAGYLLRESPLEPMRAATSFVEALNHLRADVPARLRLVARAAVGTGIVAFLLAFALAVVMVVRYGRFAANDLRRLLPKGVTPLQGGLLLAVLLVAPLAAGLGLPVALALWLVVTALFQRRTERVLAVVLLAAIGLLPTARAVASRALHHHATPDATIRRCLLEPCGDDTRARLTDWAERGIRPMESRFALAVMETRRALSGGEASLDGALRHARAANEQRPGPTTWLLLGNLHHYRGLEHCDDMRDGLPGAEKAWKHDQDQAVSNYRKALDAGHEALPLLYNAHVVLRQLERHGEAKSLLQRSLERHSTTVTRWNTEVARERNLVQCHAEAHPNRMLMPARLPSEESKAWPATAAEGVEQASGTPLFGGTAHLVAETLLGRAGWLGTSRTAFATLVLVLLLWVLAPVFRTSRPCRECGAVADPQTRLSFREGVVCERCLLIDVRRAFIDAREQWFREKQRELQLRRRTRHARLVTWFVPGCGHLVRGASVRGLLFLALVLGAVVGAFQLGALVGAPGEGERLEPIRLATAGTVAGLTWLVAVVDAHTGKTLT